MPITQEEFDNNKVNGVGVDLQFRIAWLKRNGYPVNRKNLTDVDLPTKPVEEQVALPPGLENMPLTRGQFNSYMED